MAEKIGPSYQQVVDDIRSRITSGELAVGAMIPSTADLKQQYGLSETVVRRAVRELQDHGVLVGHPGKGVYVKALPDEADGENASIKELSVQVTEVREQIGDLIERVGRMEATLATAVGRSRGGKREQATTAGTSGRQ